MEILFLIAILATIGIYYILKIPVTLFNIIFGLVLVFLFGRGLVAIFLICLGLLYVKEKFFGADNQNQ